MTTWPGKSWSLNLPQVPFVNCCQFVYLVISFLVLRAVCGIWLCQFLIIAYLYILQQLKVWNWCYCSWSLGLELNVTLAEGLELILLQMKASNWCNCCWRSGTDVTAVEGLIPMLLQMKASNWYLLIFTADEGLELMLLLLKVWNWCCCSWRSGTECNCSWRSRTDVTAVEGMELMLLQL